MLLIKLFHNLFTVHLNILNALCINTKYSLTDIKEQQHQQQFIHLA